MLIKDHHEGFIDWRTYEVTKPTARRQHPPWAAQSGRRSERGLGSTCRAWPTLRPLWPALEDALQRTQHHPWLSHCAGKIIVEGRGCYCRVGGIADRRDAQKDLPSPR